MKKLGRIITAMVTPFKDDGTIDFNAMVTLGKYLISHGSEGLLVGGTTGEGATLSKEEKLHLYEFMVNEFSSRVPIIANTGGIDTVSTIEFTKEVAKLGVDAVLVICPFYVKPTQEGLYQHFKSIAKAVDIPILIYNVPGRTRSDISVLTLKRLVEECPNIIGIKDATGDWNRVSEEKRVLPDDFLIYSGDDSMTLPIISIGGAGVISVASHIIGNDLLQMIDAYQNGNTELAKKLHLKMFPIMDGLFFITSPIPVKTALNLLGLPGGKFRLPMVEANEEETGYIRKLLLDYKLLSE